MTIALLIIMIVGFAGALFYEALAAAVALMLADVIGTFDRQREQTWRRRPMPGRA